MKNLKVIRGQMRPFIADDYDNDLHLGFPNFMTSFDISQPLGFYCRLFCLILTSNDLISRNNLIFLKSSTSESLFSYKKWKIFLRSSGEI